jgi:hypothetical protein
VGLEFKVFVDRLVKLDQIVSLVRNPDRAIRSLLHNSKSCEDIFTEYVVSHMVLTNQAAKDLACVNTNLQVDVLKSGAALFTYVSDNLKHAKCHLDGVMGLLNEVVASSLVFTDFAIVAHDDIDVTN